MNISKLMKVGMVVGAFTMLTQTAFSVPNFARQTGLSCATCHFNTPKLNSFGREFFLSGYLMSSQKPVVTTKKLQLPIDSLALFAKLTPYDKVSAASFTMPITKRLAFILAGTTGGGKLGHISFFNAIEMDDAGAPAPAPFWVGLHMAPELNLIMGNRSLAAGDPFQNITNEGRSTLGGRQHISNYGADDNKQNIALTGLVNRSIYYGVSYAADKASNVGSTAAGSAIAARGMVMLPAGLLLGGYYESGTQANVAFTKTMIDGIYEQGPLVINGAYTLNRDGGVDNNGYYVEGAYNLGNNVQLIPTVRFDSYQSAGAHTALTGSVAYFLEENVKVVGEYMTELTSPAALTNKLTAQVELGL